MPIPQRKRLLTDQQEKQIRKAFYFDKVAPDAICLKFGIGVQRLRSLVGPLKPRKGGIESVYS